MFTQVQADYLLALEKVTTEPEILIDLRLPKMRFGLTAPEDDEWEFVVDISHSEKKAFRISLHHMERRAKEGLLRVDFGGSHRNPEIISASVPEICKLYVGHWFFKVPHIHVFVEGYRDLAWALPLSDYEGFGIKTVGSSSDFASAIREFARRINITSAFQIQEAIL